MLPSVLYSVFLFCICDLCYLPFCILYFCCISDLVYLPCPQAWPSCLHPPKLPSRPQPSLQPHSHLRDEKKTQFSSGQKLDKLTLHQALPTVSPPLLSKQMHQIQDTVPPSHCSRPPKNLLEKGFHERVDKHLVLFAGPC